MKTSDSHWPLTKAPYWRAGISDVIGPKTWAPECWKTAGIYALRIAGQLYVGCSMDIHYRIREHAQPRSKTLFDQAWILQTFEAFLAPSRKELEWWESYWIELLKPSLNKRPISLAKRTERIK